MGRSIEYGCVAGVTLLLIYATTMTLFSGWQAAVEQFRARWFLMLPLAVGFGVQVGLYATLSQRVARRKGPDGTQPSSLELSTMENKYGMRAPSGGRGVTGPVGASGVSASVAMLACCAHHATDVLPLVGLSGISIFLARYQIPLLVVSLIINGMGIYIMLKHLQKL